MVKATVVETSFSKDFPFGRVQSDVKMKRKTPEELREGQDGKKLKQVIPYEIIDVDEVEDPKGVFVDGSTSDCRNKQHMKFGKGFDRQLKQPAPKKSTRIQPKAVVGNPIGLKAKAFKQFDIVSGYSLDFKAIPLEDYDRHIAKTPSRVWTKRIHHEWKVLKENLPETIYVRASAGRMDMLRACIKGVAGTPYHDGLFFFDAQYPLCYPSSPPAVGFHYNGLVHLNPNFSGESVCLSLLGTWRGRGCELWSPSNSTMLQVLVSIQSLVLNAKPYFNDPWNRGCEGHPGWERSSLLYNENVFLSSCRMMLYLLRRPPTHFEDFVGMHFAERGHAILDACRAYLDGAQVGSLVGGVQDVDEGDKSCSEEFRNSLKILYDELLVEFQKVRDGGIQATRTTPHQE